MPNSELSSFASLFMKIPSNTNAKLCFFGLFIEKELKKYKIEGIRPKIAKL